MSTINKIKLEKEKEIELEETYVQNIESDKDVLDHNKYYESTNTESSIFVNDQEERTFDSIDLEIEKDTIINNSARGSNLNGINTSKIHIQKSLFFRKIGNLNTFFYNKSGEPLIVIGPHWPFYLCLSTTISLIFLSFLYFLNNNLNMTIKLIGVFIYVTQIGSYTYVFMKNPGIHLDILKSGDTIQPERLEKGFKYCDGCHIIIWKDDEVTHCDDCNVCVIGKLIAYVFSNCGKLLRA